MTVKLEQPTMQAIIEFRQALCRLQGILLHRREKTNLDDKEFATWLMKAMRVDWGQVNAEISAILPFHVLALHRCLCPLMLRQMTFPFCSIFLERFPEAFF